MSSVVKRNDPVEFIDKLTHAKGREYAGQPFDLRDWQKRDLRKIFKVRRKKRIYQTVLWMLPRKNGKSEVAAGIALYMLLADGEPGAEVYSAAADREQASLVFNVAAQMIRNDPFLDSMCEIIGSQKRIVHRASGSFYRAISAEAYSKHGFNASCVIYDELHAAPNRDLWDVLTSSMGARSEPLTIAISTAGYDRESILYELYAHGKSVNEGLVNDPTFCAILYEAQQDDDWTDEKVWKKANPALGDFRSIDEMRIACQRAKSIPAQQNTFRRLYLNQWTESDERWIDAATWEQCGSMPDPESLIGRRCYGGLDLASTRDVTAFVLAFPSEDDETVDILPFFWIPGDSMNERVKRDRVPYDVWAREGFLNVTPGNVCDYDRVREDIRDLAEKYEIAEIAYDRWGATQLVTQLEGDGAVSVPMGQGYASMSAPMRELDKLIASKSIRHGNHPVLTWMAGNVTVAQDSAGNFKPDKKRSVEKIDGIVALVMAIDRVTRYLHEPSVYDSDDAEIFTI